MILRYNFFYIFLFFLTKIYSIEYIYPVASIDNGATIFLIHQCSPDQIKLLQWNPQTNNSEEILWSLFNPAHFQLLHDNTGFSFIDNGRLRIKLFSKRSPKAIDFDEPIININSLIWIDIHSCYCSAQQNNDYSLFHLYDNGTVNCIIADNNKDYLYPQKINTHLFYIERDKTNSSNTLSYHIMHALCPLHVVLNGKRIFDFGGQPIAFLHMLSLDEGFVVEYQKTIDIDDKTMLFFYHHLKKDGDMWKKKELFSFVIPSVLLIRNTKETLYESILPLLPHIVDKKIYFVTIASQDNYLKPYCYDLLTNSCSEIVASLQSPETYQRHCFVPKICGNRLYGGGEKQEDKEPLISFLT